MRVLVAAFALALLGALGWVATNSGPLAPTRVTTTRVTGGRITPVLFGIGTIEARRRYVIGPTSAGRVREVLADVGERVRAGQILAEMEPVDLDARVSASQAALARGLSAVAAAEAQERDARSRYELAATEARRAVEVGAAGAISRSAVDAALAQRESAHAQVASAEAALGGARRELARLQADVRGAERHRANIRLFSPVDGIVTSRDAEPGSTLVAGQSVLTLEDPSTLWVAVRLDQGRSGGLAEGLRADITRRASEREVHPGRVARVEPVSDRVTEERLAKVTFDRIPAGLSSGEMAEVVLHLPPVAAVVAIPNAALRFRDARAGVWVHDGGTIRFAPVSMGAEGGDGSVEIIGGIAAGDEIVVYSERELVDGSRITIVPSLGGAVR